MTNPYPPYPNQQPRKLERSRSNKVLGGVCGGVANYVNMDPTLVRVLTVVISLFTGVPIILYLIALFVIPEEGRDAGSSVNPSVNGPQWTYGSYPQDRTQAGTVPPNQPSYAPTAGSGDAVWGREGAPWEQHQTAAAAEPEAEPASPEQSTAEPSPAPESRDDQQP